MGAFFLNTGPFVIWLNNERSTKLLVKINQCHPDVLEHCNFPHLVAKGTNMDQVETLPFEPSASMMDAHNEDAIVIDDEPDSQPRYCQEESMPCCDSDLPKSRWCAICLEQSVGDEVPATQAEALTSEDEAAKPTAKENDEQDEKPHGRMPDEVPDLADAKVPLVARRQQLELGKATADDDEEDEEEDEKSKKRRKASAKAKAKAKSKAKAKAKATAKAKAKAKSKAKAKAKSSSKAPKRKAAEEDPSEEDKKKHKDNKTANEVAENQDEEIKIAENKSQEKKTMETAEKKDKEEKTEAGGKKTDNGKEIGKEQVPNSGVTTFARRYMPDDDLKALKYRAIRDVYMAMVAPYVKGQSKYQDKGFKTTDL